MVFVMGFLENPSHSDGSPKCENVIVFFDI